MAEFNCTAVANSFAWFANGQQIDNGDEGVSIATVAVDGTQNIRISTLILTVSSTDNATNITCHVVLLTPISISSVDSNPALLLVQGIVLRWRVLINL